MKRLLALLLAIVMVVALCSCEGKKRRRRDRDDDDDTTNATQEVISTDDVVKPIEDEEDNIGNAVTKPLPDDDGDDETPAGQLPLEESKKDEYAVGSISGDTWTNESLGISFTLPSDMRIATDEELQSVLQSGAAAISPDATDNVLDYINKTSIYELYAIGSDGGSVQVLFEKASSLISEERYLESVQSGLKSLYDFEFTEIGTIDVGGKEFYGFAGGVQANGTGVYQLYACKRVGERMGCIILTSLSESEIENLVGTFTAA